MQNVPKRFGITKLVSVCLAVLLALPFYACAPDAGRADDTFVEISHIPAGLTTEMPRRKLVAFHGDDCWTYINDTLVRYDMKKQEIVFTMPMVLGSLAYQQCIDIDSETGHIYVMRTEMDDNTQDAMALERRIFLLELDRDGAEVKRWPLKFGWDDYADVMEVVDGRAFVWAHYDNRLREIDLATGQMRLLELPLVGDFAKCGDGLVLLLADNTGAFNRVGVYAPETGTLVKEFTAAFDVYPSSLRLVDTDGSLVYAVASGGSIHRIDLETEQAALLFMPSMDLSTGPRGGGMDDGKLYVLMSSGEIDCYANLDGSWDFGNVLRIMTPNTENFMDRMTSTARDYLGNGAYPGLHVAYVKTGDESQYYANVVKKLMAKDADFDLFVVRQSDYGVFEKGMFEDLRQYPDIAASFDRMLPGVAAFASHEGKIIGYPTIRQVALYDYNGDKLDAFGITAPPAILTMEEYEGLFANANDAFAAQKPVVGVGPHDLYRSLSTGFFTYEKELTEQDVTACFADAKRMVESGIVSTDLRDANLFVMQSSSMFSRSQGRMIIPLDRADDPYSISADFLCVNPYAENKETALAYIEVLASVETERTALDMYVSGMLAAQRWVQEDQTQNTEPSQSEIQAIVETTGTLFLYDTEALHGNPNYELYTQLLARSTKEHARTELGFYFWELLMKVCDGTIDEQTAASGLFKKMKMVRDE